jgi:hypothetical protein
MEKEKGEEIIGYRIGQGLFCVECYEEGARTLKAVQNPEDPEVKIPSRPITAEDVTIFICEQCKTIKGPKAGELKIQEQKDLTDLQDTVENCASKIAFLEDFFCHNIPYDELLSEEGKSGLNQILIDLEIDLNSVVNEMSQQRQKGLIIERQKRS